MPDNARPRTMRAVVLGASLGTAFEYYDFLTYATLASVFSDLFFPVGNMAVSILLSAGTFGVAYLSRPFGAVLFGPVADRIGRKSTLTLTMTIMGLATVLMGCLPTYAQMGLVAPFCLVCLRLVQGLSIGGEYGAAVSYVAEHAPANRIGFFTSVLQATALMGLLAALGVVSGLRLALDASQFHAWGWRVAFVLSAPILVVALIVRLRLAESPAFERLVRSGAVAKSPLSETLLSLSSWKAILLALFGGQGGQTLCFYTAWVYTLYFLQAVLKVDPSMASAMGAASVIVGIVVHPMFGALSDRVGRARVMLIGIALVTLTCYPIFRAVREAVESASWVAAAGWLCLLSILAAMVVAPAAAFSVQVFPPRTRATGYGVAQQISNILFGGFLPLIGLTLVQWTGNELAGVFYPIALLIVCGVVNVLWALPRDQAQLAEKAPQVKAQAEAA